MNFETNKHSAFFHVLEMNESNVDYNETLSIINMTVRKAFVIYGRLKLNMSPTIGQSVFNPKW